MHGAQPTFAIPAARGRGGDRRTFAILVAGIDRSQPDEAAIVGERVDGHIAAPAGSLLLVYGEDRGLPDSPALHCIDLYRVERGGMLHRLDHGTLTGAWVPVALEAIEQARASADEPPWMSPLRRRAR